MGSAQQVQEVHGRGVGEGTPDSGNDSWPTLCFSCFPLSAGPPLCLCGAEVRALQFSLKAGPQKTKTELWRSTAIALWAVLYVQEHFYIFSHCSSPNCNLKGFSPGKPLPFDSVECAPKNIFLRIEWRKWYGCLESLFVHLGNLAEHLITSLVELIILFTQGKILLL